MRRALQTQLDGYTPGLSPVKQLRRRAASRLLLEIDVAERLPIAVADDEQASVSSTDWGGV
jgi:hypothetical protein